MRAYAFIEDLNIAVLKKSKGIQGRFFMSKKTGLEINTDTLSQVLNDALSTLTAQKYPLALMIPPVSLSNYATNEATWDMHRFTIFFLKASYRDGMNNIAFPNSMQTSTHTVTQDWHDMKRCAIGYLKALNRVQRTKNLVANSFRLDPSDQIIQPVSLIGTDGASGVRLDYKASLLLDCGWEDYIEEDIDDIEIPVADSHPIHDDL